MSKRRPEILALIPARGGSRSIPRKNLLTIAGRPLIAYSIDHARASRHITRTIVSTDDEEIARVAIEHGAEVPFMRPAAFAQDHSPDVETFQHALSALAEQGYSCDAVVHLRPTGPVRSVSRLDEAIELFLEHPEADSLRSVTTPAHTPYKMWRIVHGLLEPVIRLDGVESYCLPRQQLPEVFWQNGYVDIVRPDVVLQRGLMCGDRIVPFVMREPVYELDYVENIPHVEAALRAQQQTHQQSVAHWPVRHPV